MEHLFCTCCKIELDRAFYNIFQHPILEVPICRYCEQTVSRKNVGDDENICAWCMNAGNPTETMLRCCSGACFFRFCTSCLSRNFGDAFVESISDSDAKWICLKCNPSQLKCFRDSLKIGQEISMYGQDIWDFLGKEERNLPTIGVDAIQDDIDRFEIVITQLKEAIMRLESDKGMAEVEAGIRTELAAEDW
jgi:hypothetical protein